MSSHVGPPSDAPNRLNAALSIRAVAAPIFAPGGDLAPYAAAAVIRALSLSTPTDRACSSIDGASSHIDRAASSSGGRERLVVAVTSKIASLAERRLEPRASIAKPDLVRREADVFLGETRFGVALTIKENLLIPSAGIDESNSASGDFILYPERPFETARRLWEALRGLLGARELGVILTDSHVAPLRRGVTGVALAHWGFRGVRNLVGAPDLFGRPLSITQINAADALAAAAVFAMGEGGEGRPVAVISGADVEFADAIDPNEIRIPPEEDLYGELLAHPGD